MTLTNDICSVLVAYDLVGKTKKRDKNELKRQFYITDARKIAALANSSDSESELQKKIRDYFLYNYFTYADEYNPETGRFTKHKPIVCREECKLKNYKLVAEDIYDLVN